MLGVMSTRDAQRMAENRGLDLVEITPNATPPVCKIMDYGKFKYEQFVVDGKSPFLNTSIKESGIRNDYRCLVVGVEKEAGNLLSPEADMLLEDGDVVWVVGEKEDVYHLVN